MNKKEKYLNNWILQQKWLDKEALENEIQNYQSQTYQSLLFSEWLLIQKSISVSQFQKYFEESKKTHTLVCKDCHKFYLGKLAPLPQCVVCKKSLTLEKVVKEEPREGTFLGNCFLARKLGKGGMGTVYLAFHQELQEWVAFKVLTPKVDTSEDEIKRFLLEGKTASQLDHANIVPVLQSGEENETLFMIQKYVEGQSLRVLLEESGKLPLEHAVPIFEDICRGLNRAHQAKIIHRDIKPDNVMRNAKGECRITDFGLAKLTDASQSISVSGEILGTPSYMSPEQAESKPVDHRTDIYALGITLFEMLTGEVPYRGNSPMATLYKHVHEPVPDLAETEPTLPEIWVQIFNQCVAKDPQERFQSCQEILELFESQSTLSLQKQKKQKKQNNNIFAILGGVGILLVCLFLFFSSRSTVSEKHFLFQKKSFQNLPELYEILGHYQDFLDSGPSLTQQKEMQKHLRGLLDKNLKAILDSEELEIYRLKAQKKSYQTNLEKMKKLKNKIAFYDFLEKADSLQKKIDSFALLEKNVSVKKEPSIPSETKKPKTFSETKTEQKEPENETKNTEPKKVWDAQKWNELLEELSQTIKKSSNKMFPQVQSYSKYQNICQQLCELSKIYIHSTLDNLPSSERALELIEQLCKKSKYPDPFLIQFCLKFFDTSEQTTVLKNGAYLIRKNRQYFQHLLKVLQKRTKTEFYESIQIEREPEIWHSKIKIQNISTYLFLVEPFCYELLYLQQKNIESVEELEPFFCFLILRKKVNYLQKRYQVLLNVFEEQSSEYPFFEALNSKKRFFPTQYK